MEISY
jgi:hypothetical protein